MLDLLFTSVISGTVSWQSILLCTFFSLLLGTDDKNRKGEIYRILMVDKQLPDFGMEIEKVSYNDGCKVYFKNGGFIISRFSGTEPLLRIFCELDSMQHAEDTIKIMSDFLKL